MNEVKILIVEDEVLIAEFILELLTDESFKNVKTVHSKEEAIRVMNEFEPDIILMDINLNGNNSGIELSKQKNTNAAVIFLTGQYDFELRSKALDTEPESYLTKPIKQNDLFAAIQLAYLKNQVKSITVKNGSDTIKIKFNSILYVKSDGNYIDIYTINRKYSVRMQLDVFLNETKDSNFIRVHRSYIINKSKITRMNGSTAFINTIEIPISRNLNLDF